MSHSNQADALLLVLLQVIAELQDALAASRPKLPPLAHSCIEPTFDHSRLPAQHKAIGQLEATNKQLTHQLAELQQECHGLRQKAGQGQEAVDQLMKVEVGKAAMLLALVSCS